MSGLAEQITKVLREHPRYDDGCSPPLNACVCGHFGDYAAHVASVLEAAVMAPVIELVEKWENATELGTGNPSIVARAFGAELRDALAAGWSPVPEEQP